MNSLKEKKECPGKEIRLLWRHIIMRQNRADRDDEFVEVRVHVGSLLTSSLKKHVFYN